MTRDETRDHILQVAGPIFAAEGFQGTTVRAICQAAGVNVAAVNYYFGDKERLYVEAVKHARTLIDRRWPLPELPESTPPEQRLKSVIETFSQRVLSPETQAWQMKLLLREAIEPTGACDEMLQEGIEPFFANLLSILRELVPAETVDAHLHQIGFSIVGQCIFYRAHHRIVEWMTSEEQRNAYFTPEGLADHIYRFSLGAIRSLHHQQECRQ